MNAPRSTSQNPRNSDLVVTLTRGELVEIVSDAVAMAIAGAERPTLPALLDRQQLAQQLGISVRTLTELRRRGLPTLWLLDSPRFELAAVLDWLRANREPQAESAGSFEAQAVESTGESPAVAPVLAAPILPSQIRPNNSAHLRRVGGRD